MLNKYEYLWDINEEIVAQVVCSDEEVFVTGRVIDRRDGISTSYEILGVYSQEDWQQWFEKMTLQEVEKFFDDMYKNCNCEEE